MHDINALQTDKRYLDRDIVVGADQLITRNRQIIAHHYFLYIINVIICDNFNACLLLLLLNYCEYLATQTNKTEEFVNHVLFLLYYRL